jgi:hypothetical protein
MEMLVDAQTQIARNPLSDAGRKIVIDIACDCADDRACERCDACKQCHAQRMLAKAGVFMRPIQPVRQMVVAERIVDDELERPRRSQTGADLDKHGEKDDGQPAAIGSQKLDHQT